MIGNDEWLEEAARMPLPGGRVLNHRAFVVMHFTGGWTGKGAVEFWRSPEARGACAHIVIDRDGSIIQCRPFNRTAGHAGHSRWKDLEGKLWTDLNSSSIGIELANCGDLSRSHYPDTMPPEFAGKSIPRLTARHRNGGPLAKWETYPTAQIAAAARVATMLRLRYNLDECLGHDDIAPERKNDPGPAFNMKAFRIATGFPA